MKVYRYDRLTRRVWILNMRIHHGLMGVLVLLGGASVVGWGIRLIADDWHDRPWLRDNA